jgi:hypothetical protein
MIPPSRESRRIESASAPEPRQTVKSDEKVVTPVHEKPVAIDPVAIDIAPPIAGEKKTGSVREVRTVEPAKTETIFIESPKPPASEAVRSAPVDVGSPAWEPAPRITVVEHRELVEQETASAISADQPGKLTPPETLITETVEQPRFFVKTAELIEKGEASSDDIGGILFQEVRQWVSSGPAEPQAPAANPEAVETVTVRDINHREREPGTVMIGERFHQERSSEPAALAEQNFNLSIGTISVIIEDPEKPAEPVRVIQNEPAQNNSSDTKREFSRFSRNYL